MGDNDAPRPGTRKLYKFFNKPPRIAYALGLGPIIGRLVLLLTTRGRKTGLLRVTPLQYEQIEEKYYVASAFGTRTDWYRNILADPGVRVRVGRKEFEALAETSTDPARIAGFLEVRLARHPRMIGMMLRAEGLPPSPSRQDLESLAADKALVILHPTEKLKPGVRNQRF
ncbi:MAG: nitroreductase family deazaflavin-dependent oxidoreductase [Anaerolineales bacterium]|nr:nitroreductase family deazaflavin-dependent oxidoreductase [Anaerolineales bacterium]